MQQLFKLFKPFELFLEGLVKKAAKNQSDEFAIMMFSAAYNFLVMVVVMWVQRADKVYNR